MSQSIAAAPLVGKANRARRVLSQVETFFLAPASARPLAALRIGLGLLLLVQCYLLRGSVLDFFSNDGLIQGDLAAAFGSTSGLPRLSWFVALLEPLHVSASACIFGVCWLYVASLVCLTAGAFTRVAVVLSWFLHWTLMNTGETTAYGVDIYAHVALFYLMWGPCGGAFSLDALRRGVQAPSSSARLVIRVLQLHLCVSYLCSAVEKATGPQWWNGELLWRAMNLPVYAHFNMSWLAFWPRLSQAAGIGSLFLELGYCVFIWPRRTRKIWVAGMVSMHLGIALFLNLGLFGVVMALLTLTVFGVPAD